MRAIHVNSRGFLLMRSLSILAAICMVAAFLLPASTSRAANCDFPGEPQDQSGVRLQRLVAGFSRPVVLKFIPGYHDRYYVVEQYGLLKLVINNQVQSRVALDLRQKINTDGNETGFLGLEFHPDFIHNHRVFINYTTSGQLHTHISEFHANADLSIDPASERVLIDVQQPYSNHNGGDLHFGPDGYLYFGLGDGGSGGDPHGNGQNLRTLLAKISRIDVDHGDPYVIPPDNPHFSDSNARPEIFAYGLRNPWRFSFDRVTGDLWAGDVGQDQWEEVDLVSKGGNYGWNTMEGTHCYNRADCDRTGLTLPVLDYPRSEGASVTGGYVYRGAAMPDLLGSYLYADYVSKNLWAIRYDGTSVTSRKLLLANDIAISAFDEDQQGELYVLDHENGVVYKLVPDTTPAAPSAFPRTVSATGCFSRLNPLTPIAGAVAYSVRAPLWSDGAVKERFVYVPHGAKLHFAAETPWQFPLGTVLIKNFYLPQSSGSTAAASTRKLVETRFLVKRDTGFKGYTYQWNDVGTDAVLLGGAVTKTMTIVTEGGDEAFDYYFPSSSDCQRCHVAGFGGALGVNTPQLNFVVRQADGTSINAIKQLVTAGILDASGVPDDMSQLPALSDPEDTSAGLDQRARTYLHIQCAHCHNPDNGGRQGDLDLRYNVTFSAMHVCDQNPTQGDLGIAGAKVLKPGDPDKSLLWVRMQTLDHHYRMPPVASNRVDQQGSTLLRNWISGIGGCP